MTSTTLSFTDHGDDTLHVTRNENDEFQFNINDGMTYAELDDNQIEELIAFLAGQTR